MSRSRRHIEGHVDHFAVLDVEQPLEAHRG